MDTFQLNKKFDDYKSLLAAKKEYENASNTILTTESSHLLQGEGDFVISKKYERISYGCKAGKERSSHSKGIRRTSTYKANCPFKVCLKLIDGKFSVTEINSSHENHETDRNTFLAYPESVRLTENEVEVAKRMVESGGSKQRIKALLSKERDAPIPLRSLHNLATKIRLSKQTNNRKEDFKHLIDMMACVPNARIRVITNEQDEFLGLYFQDERMAHLFEKYPEIVFYDATHNLNNKKFPLFIQLCIDGNGNSEIISIYLCVSESRQGVGSMIDAFKELNSAWIKTKVILGDKDFADRDVYSEKFVNAVMKICIFHVMRTFRREITTYKRDITSSQRDEALNILQRLVYSCSEEQYEAAYSQLINLNLEHVTEYYNENWHCIREQWTLFGLNEHCSYMNTTNNRLESLNQKLKLVGNRNANLQSFFENLSISISNSSSEKDLAALRGKMRRSRQCFDDAVLQSYKDFLTPFAFSKIEIQYEVASEVEFTYIEGEDAIVNNKRVDTVSLTSCSCLFFSSMELPCRHVFKLMMVVELDPFAPQLCSTRWTKAYFEASHPALLLQKKINRTTAVYTRVRNQNDIDHYKKSTAVAKEVKDFVLELSPANQKLFLEKMKSFTNDISTPTRTEANSQYAFESLGLNNSNEVFEAPLDLSKKKPSDANPVENLEYSSTSNVELHNNSNKENLQPQAKQQNVVQDQPSSFSSSQPIAILSSVENIKIPDNITPVGRPKGSSLTVIGTKRKRNSKKSNLSKRIAEGGSPQKFSEKSSHQKAVTVIQWLTNNFSGTSKKKISSKDIVIDENVFNRLRNDEVSLDHLKELVDHKCLEFLQNELAKIKDKPWNCSKCNSLLSNYQVRCDFCLDWFHFNCVQYKNSDTFVCITCD